MFLHFTFFIDSLITFECVGFLFFATFLDIKLYSRGWTANDEQIWRFIGFVIETDG